MSFELAIENTAVEFAQRFASKPAKPPVYCRKRLRDYILLSVVGSGVRYEIASEIVGNLSISPCEKEIKFVASKHRFPKQTQKRLEYLFEDNGERLELGISILVSSSSPRIDRKKLADLIFGVGAKQSGFVFQLSGRGDNLAVLDRHIYRFMIILGLVNSPKPASTWAEYEKYEQIYLDYCDRVSLPADALDAGIWITMKAAGRKVNECAPLC